MDGYSEAWLPQKRDEAGCHTWLAPMAALCLGSLAHQILRSFEADSKQVEILQAFAALNLLSTLAAWQTLCRAAGLFAALRLVLVLNVPFLAGLFTSIAIYRIFFHRLGRFPGPFGARVTKFWALRQAAATLQWNETVRDLHRVYGDFVRIGPREISINRPSAIQALYGPPSTLLKGPWYAQLSNDPHECSINATRDGEDHRRRRRAWDRGLGVKALSSYSERMSSKADKLVSQLAAREGQSINFTKWGFYYAFDIMGVVGLGTDFGMVDSGTEHEAIAALHGQMIAVGVLGTVPWLLSLLAKLPVSGGFGIFMNFCISELDKKLQTLKPGQEPRDILSWILMARYEGDRSSPGGRLALEDDARLLITAGSDTSAAVVTNALFFLATHPQKLKKLQSLLDAAFPAGSQDWTWDRARHISYLTHIINETMRIKAPIPLGLPRLTPPGGLLIDGTHIPGDVVVSVPTHAIQLDPRYFEDPEEFRPERWEDISSVDDVPFLPFSRGSYACAGKQLAMMEIQTVISKIALAFDFTLAEEADGGRKFDKNWQDTFVLTLPELPLVFKARKASQ